MDLQRRVTKKILQYGRQYIKDQDNIIALEICFIIDREFERERRRLCQKKRKSSKSGSSMCSL